MYGGYDAVPFGLYGDRVYAIPTGVDVGAGYGMPIGGYTMARVCSVGRHRGGCWMVYSAVYVGGYWVPTKGHS